MANGTINLVSTKNVLEGRIVWNATSNGSSANSSNITAEIQIRRNDGYTTEGTWEGALNVGGKIENFSVHATVNSTWVTMKTISNVIAHNSDGTGTCYLESYCNGPTGTSMAGASVSGKATVTLDKIERYVKITNFSIKSKTVDSITIQYSTDNEVDYAQYSLNGGSWIDLNVNNSITGLSIDSTYSVKIRVRGKASGLWTESSTITVTTYDIAKISSVSNFNHGDSASIVITNPSR